ncbi:DUF4232 domain-containing protein [Streptomyces sp. NPDC014733]|uniref:DUF4232 domain-containing protein n=1 Tax=Streptomyces sp. NPDC014733 TaxID=3364885 RepID=UPI0036F7402A
MTRTSQPQSAPRTRRIGMRIAAAGLVAVAGFSLTACGQSEDRLKTSDGRPFDAAPQDSLDTGTPGKNGGVHTDGGRPSGAGEEAKSTTSGTGGSGGGRTDSGDAPGTGGTAPSQGDTGGDNACDPAHLNILATQLPRPANHLLLRVKNTSGATCNLYAYPILRFDEAQSPVAPLEDSKPQAVVTLAPGESGYAAIMTSSPDGSGTNGHQRTSLGVSLADRDGQGGSGEMPVTLPGGATYLDDSAWVTYWQSDMASAANR